MGKTELSIRAYAAHRKSKGLVGGNKSAVERAIASGRIARTASGKIDPELADRQWEQNSDPAKRPVEALESIDEVLAEEGAPAGDSEAASYAAARARREEYQARLAKLEYEERAGTLTSTEEVKAAAFRAGRLTRDKVLAVPARVAAIFAAETDSREIERQLADELRQALVGVPGE